MAPIRIGIIGLSKTGWAHNAHVPYLLTSPKYKIVAVCNSSEQSARESIELHKLPSNTKAYGNPEDLAHDPNVDLVVCTVRVDSHFPTIAPALRAGKSAFVEWPLGKNLKEAEELLRLSKEHGVKKTAVGLQGRAAPVIRQLKKLMEEGRIGKVLSSTWTGSAGNLGPEEKLIYLADKEVGGNLVTIHFGHVVDYVQQVLGTFKSAESILANRRPVIQIVSGDGAVVHKHYQKTSEDTIMVQGIVGSDAPLSLNLRGGKPFKGLPGMDWRIYGEKGEIRVTASGAFLHIGYPDVSITVHDIVSDEVEVVALDQHRFDDLPIPAQNVAMVYEAFADGDDSVLCDFEDAVKRHLFIDILYKQNSRSRDRRI